MQMWEVLSHILMVPSLEPERMMSSKAKTEYTVSLWLNRVAILHVEVKKELKCVGNLKLHRKVLPLPGACRHFYVSQVLDVPHVCVCVCVFVCVCV